MTILFFLHYQDFFGPINMLIPQDNNVSRLKLFWWILKLFYRKNRELKVLIELLGDGNIGAFTTMHLHCHCWRTLTSSTYSLEKKQKQKTKSLKALSIFVFLYIKKTSLWNSHLELQQFLLLSQRWSAKGNI